MTELFGTDGVRGVANEYPITPEMALRIGKVAAAYFKNTCPAGGKPAIVVGKDTRCSGDMVEHALVAGITAIGVDALLTGVLPTPGIAYLTRKCGATAGIVISASHNPYYDNGIKFFDHEGYKLGQDIEKEIEAMIIDENSSDLGIGNRDVGRIRHLTTAVQDYSTFLIDVQERKVSLKGMKIILDCANGATFEVAPTVFTALGADVTAMFVEPDGTNINAECGSQHPESLVSQVRSANADIGLAFDGDGDRLIAVTEKGAVASGDQILALCARDLKNSGLLTNNLLVSTVMSNMGLRAALDNMGIKHLTTKVGDRFVMESMRRNNAVVGGEDSGHLIFLNHHTTGDGVLAAVKLAEILARENRPLSELMTVMTVFPQELINVTVKSKPPLETVPVVADAVKAVEDRLGKQGRVLVRYSGTQPMCRVMVEGPTEQETRDCCRIIADAVQSALG